MNKLKAITASLALVAITLAPLALAHNDNQPAVPLGPAASDDNRVSGVYYKDVSVLADHTGMDVSPGNSTSFTFGAANALCDMEVLSDGSTTGAQEDESRIDGSDGGLTAVGLFNDGGVGAVCHTHSSYYAEGSFNTVGCDYSAGAEGDDLSTNHVWLSTVCEYGYSTGGIGLAGYLLSCVNNVLTGTPADVVPCALAAVGCFVDSPTACPLSTGFACGRDASGAGGEQTPGVSGWSDDAGGVAFESVPSPCTNDDGTAAVFVWTAVVVNSVAGTADVSAPTVGVIY